MSFIVLPSKQLRKTVKKYQRGGKRQVIESLTEVIDLLAMHDSRALFVLHDRWKDHELKGDKRGIRELHLSMDELLLYRVDALTQTIKLMDITNHEKLRKKKS